MAETPEAILWDMDGTLVDSAPDIHASVNATLREAGLRTLPLDRVRSFIGGGVEMLWAQIAAELRHPARTGSKPWYIGWAGPFTDSCIHLRDLAEPQGLDATVPLKH